MELTVAMTAPAWPQIYRVEHGIASYKADEEGLIHAHPRHVVELTSKYGAKIVDPADPIYQAHAEGRHWEQVFNLTEKP